MTSDSKWKLVPVEPTEEMQLAGLRALEHGGLGDCNCDQIDVWMPLPEPPAALAKPPGETGAGE